MQLFREISTEEAKQVITCIQPRVARYPSGEIVVLAGEPQDHFGLVLSGSVQIARANVRGENTLMGVVCAGDSFGELAAFSGEATWPATVVAKEACTVVFVRPQSIAGTCSRSCAGHRQLILNALRIVSQRALMLRTKIEYLSYRTLRARISAFLLDHLRESGRGKFDLPYTRAEFADFLNVSRPSLSREMGRMQKEGIIRFHRRHVEILDANMLRDSVH